MMQVISRSSTLRRVAPDKNRSLHATKCLSQPDSCIESFVRPDNFPRNTLFPRSTYSKHFFTLKNAIVNNSLFYDYLPLQYVSSFKFEIDPHKYTKDIQLLKILKANILF